MDDFDIRDKFRTLGYSASLKYCTYLLRDFGYFLISKRTLVKKDIISICSVSYARVCRGVVLVKKVRGSATVEMAYMMPVIFLVFVSAIYMVFYLHDKNIVIGAAYETAIVGAQKLQWDEENVIGQMEDLFQERIKGKLIFFSRASAEIEIDETKVCVNARARKGRIGMSAIQKVSISDSEKYIRDLRRIQNVWKPNTGAD